MKITFGIVLCILIALSGCAIKQSAAPGDGLSDAEFRAAFADRAVYLWEGEDYTYGGDGAYGIDGAGVVIMTLREMGYDLELTVADGLYDNLITELEPFGFTLPSETTDAALAAGDYSGLRKGDLIFLDYDFDDVYDHVAIYLGAYDTITHAAFNASDYYEECVISDMGNAMDPFNTDLQYSAVSSRALDRATIETLYEAP